MNKSLLINKKIKPFNKKINVDGDKSLSIRFIIFASLAKGKSKAYKILKSEDVISALNCIKKLGIKVNILVDRLVELWNGPEYKEGMKDKGVRRKANGKEHMTSQADYLDKTQLLPSNTQLTAMPQQNKPDFNQMYQQNNNSLLPTEGMQDLNPEPVAANGALGGMFGGSAW